MANKISATLEQALSKILSSNAVAIVLPDELNLELIYSAVALKYGLSKLKKNAKIFAPKVNLQKQLPSWNGAAEDETLREFIISFDLTRSPIKELKYERDSNRLNIILSPNGPIRREDVEFRYGALHYDLVITVGVSNPEKAAASIAQAPELLYERPILNVDTGPANNFYGETNLVAGGDTGARVSIVEQIFKVLAGLKVLDGSPEVLNALLAAILAATKNFANSNVSPETFAITSQLLKLGGNLELAREQTSGARSLNIEQLTARAIARSRFDEKTATCWSVLTKDDFAKTGTNWESWSVVLDGVKNAVRGAGHYVLLFQSSESAKIKAAIARERKIEQEKSAIQTHRADFDDLAILADHYNSFAEAEDHISQLLPSANALQ